MPSSAAPHHQAILEHALAAFQAETGYASTLFAPPLPASGSTSDAPAPTGQVEFTIAQQKIRFPIQVKPVDRFQSLGMLKAAPGDAQCLLVAPWLSNAMAKQCRELAIPFIDTAGNANLFGDGIQIFISGLPRPAAPMVTNKSFRALTPAGLRILFVLLTQPGLLAQNYRQIAAAAGVALGSIGPALADLQARGFLLADPTGPARIVERAALIDEWATQYPIRLRPKLPGWRFTAPQPDWWQTCPLQPEQAQWGGEVAAAKLTGYLNPARVTLYANGKPDQIILANRLRPSPTGEIEILQPFWGAPAKQENHAQCVPPLLIYADLINSADARNLEAAQLIRERYLV